MRLGMNSSGAGTVLQEGSSSMYAYIYIYVYTHIYIYIKRAVGLKAPVLGSEFECYRRSGL